MSSRSQGASVGSEAMSLDTTGTPSRMTRHAGRSLSAGTQALGEAQRLDVAPLAAVPRDGLAFLRHGIDEADPRHAEAARLDGDAAGALEELGRT
jgi:hypothetical protein